MLNANPVLVYVLTCTSKKFCFIQVVSVNVILVFVRSMDGYKKNNMLRLNRCVLTCLPSLP